MNYESSPQFVKNLINYTIDIEGDYSDDPLDRGGKTKYGITEAVARAYGYTGNMADLPINIARDIFAKNYYYKPRIDLINIESTLIAEEVFDTAVNMGTGRAIGWLQECLNVLNDNQRLYPDIKEDGVMGPNTQATLRKYLSIRKFEGEQVLYKALNCLQGEYYIRIAQGRKTDQRFLYGWLANRVVLK
jgi:lysozyme family protein